MTVDTDGTYLVRNGTPYSLHSEFVSIKLDNSLERSQDLLFAFPKLYKFLLDQVMRMFGNEKLRNSCE